VRTRRFTVLIASAAATFALAGCAGSASNSDVAPSTAEPSGATSSSTSPAPTRAPDPNLLPGMPAPLDPANVYAADGPGMLSAAVAHDLPRVYVPNTGSNTVTVIDPTTYRVIGTLRVGHQPQHVVPAWDLRTLWVNNDLGDSLTPIDPRTGKVGTTVQVWDPYNLYFTPDGKHAVVMASKLRRLDFRDPHTMALQRSVHVPCAGVNHADWTADGRFFLASCEFSGQLLWVDTAREKVVRVLDLPRGSMPQDVKLSPDGTKLYVADMMSNGVWIYDVTPTGPKLRRLLPTGAGAHGLYVSRDAMTLYVSNRGNGTISLVRFTDDHITATWKIPGHASPDMGNLSADGRTLWLAGRYDNEVYAIDTTTGALRARIPVGIQPHGLTVWPQPGRYSLGHTGIMR
jgi:YVTN family beta-propeller protein